MHVPFRVARRSTRPETAASFVDMAAGSMWMPAGLEKYMEGREMLGADGCVSFFRSNPLVYIGTGEASARAQTIDRNDS
jgi:hypothetical protein